MDRQYVGIDFHRRRSVIVHLSGSGEGLGLHRIVNEPFELAKVIALCGESDCRRHVVQTVLGKHRRPARSAAPARPTKSESDFSQT
jgi:hypothetical protein